MIAIKSRKEILQLVAIFLTWKAFLLFIAITSPGLGYDTSTSLLGQSTHRLSDRLVRWDAIYYTKVAQRGYVFEQEWAFGWGFTWLLNKAASFLSQYHDFPLAEALAGITLSHLSHLISVLALYDMTALLFTRVPGFPNIAYTASVLHIVSPAGLFLSGPCAESLFSSVSFIAYDLYIRSQLSQQYGTRKDIYQLIAALLFGVSATVRSNGLLNGLLFATDALHGCLTVIQQGIGTERIRRLAIIGLCGGIVGFGYFIPQYIAYQEYCSTAELRPWCSGTFPSIYNFVQAHYWNTGLFKYWTFSNAPLFVIGGPCIALSTASAWWAWTTGVHDDNKQKLSNSDGVLANTILRTLALPQSALVVLILSSYHVQIINRLSSGYPLWYWWLAKVLHQDGTTSEGKTARIAVIWMVGYATVQGALFASFLPPA